MKILAIDTCTESTSITLLSNDNKYTRSIIGLAKSSGEVLNMCNEIFNEAKIEKKDIQAIAYTQGPGSFTGVRMCISVVQGLSFSLNIPIIGFSTLGCSIFLIISFSNFDSIELVSCCNNLCFGAIS